MGGRTLLDVKVNHNILVIKTMLINQIDQWDKIGSADSYKYDNLICHKDVILNQEAQDLIKNCWHNYMYMEYYKV